jgi:hypothetical protein
MIKGYRKIRCFRWCVPGPVYQTDIFRNIKAIRAIFRSVRFYRVSRFPQQYCLSLHSMIFTLLRVDYDIKKNKLEKLKT